ncbi:uncharacterized protein PHA67_004633 isoform 1-T2 [Liasis olivaceus]
MRTVLQRTVVPYGHSLHEHQLLQQEGRRLPTILVKLEECMKKGSSPLDHPGRIVSVWFCRLCRPDHRPFLSNIFRIKFANVSSPFLKSPSQQREKANHRWDTLCEPVLIPFAMAEKCAVLIMKAEEAIQQLLKENCISWCPVLTNLSILGLPSTVTQQET